MQPFKMFNGKLHEFGLCFVQSLRSFFVYLGMPDMRPTLSTVIFLGHDALFEIHESRGIRHIIVVLVIMT